MNSTIKNCIKVLLLSTTIFATYLGAMDSRPRSPFKKFLHRRSSSKNNSPQASPRPEKKDRMESSGKEEESPVPTLQLPTPKQSLQLRKKVLLQSPRPGDVREITPRSSTSPSPRSDDDMEPMGREWQESPRPASSSSPEPEQKQIFKKVLSLVSVENALEKGLTSDVIRLVKQVWKDGIGEKDQDKLIKAVYEDEVSLLKKTLREADFRPSEYKKGIYSALACAAFHARNRVFPELMLRWDTITKNSEKETREKSFNCLLEIVCSQGHYLPEAYISLGLVLHRYGKMCPDFVVKNKIYLSFIQQINSELPMSSFNENDLENRAEGMAFRGRPVRQKSQSLLKGTLRGRVKKEDVQRERRKSLGGIIDSRQIKNQNAQYFGLSRAVLDEVSTFRRTDENTPDLHLLLEGRK